MHNPAHTIVISAFALQREALTVVLSESGFYRVRGAASLLEAAALLSDVGLGPVLLLVATHDWTEQDVQTIAEIKRAKSETTIVVLTEGLHSFLSDKLQRAGVDAILVTRIGKATIVRYLELVLLGERLFDPRACSEEGPVELSQPNEPSWPQSNLTPREREVLSLVARGLSNKQTARELVVTSGTVKTHVENLFRKLGVRNRTQLAAWTARPELRYKFASGRTTVREDVPPNLVSRRSRTRL